MKVTSVLRPCSLIHFVVKRKSPLNQSRYKKSVSRFYQIIFWVSWVRKGGFRNDVRVCRLWSRVHSQTSGQILLKRHILENLARYWDFFLHYSYTYFWFLIFLNSNLGSKCEKGLNRGAVIKDVISQICLGFIQIVVELMSKISDKYRC